MGGGGGNAVNYMYRQNIPYVNFVVTNTDKQALNKSPVPNKLILGYQIAPRGAELKQQARSGTRMRRGLGRRNTQAV